MALFSQRKGIRPLQKSLQRESIDDELRNRLWSAVKLSIWDNWSPRAALGLQQPSAQQVEHLVSLIWLHHFKAPIDTIPSFDVAYPKSAYQVLRDYFFECNWWEVYDFIEFLVKVSEDEWSKHLTELVNAFLETENAAYRIVDKEIVEITDETEIISIESAIEKGTKSVRAHLQRALELLSDKKQPDYRNSIKESISAVESTCQTISGNSKATLGDSLKLLKSKKPLHPAFEAAIVKLYGYTSDGGGIRHSLTESTEQPSFADAKFMLVACSAFTNYLWTKAAEDGIQFSKD